MAKSPTRNRVEISKDERYPARHIENFDNPHKVTKSDLGLDKLRNVEVYSKEEVDDLVDKNIDSYTKTESDNRYSLLGHTHSASDVDSGTFADARIAESNVTQHQSSLVITESQITDLSHTPNYYLSGLSFDGGTGVLTATISGASNQTVDLDGRYSLLAHNHSASDITSGQFANARISEASVTQHEEALDPDNIPLSTLGSPTYSSIQDFVNLSGSVGRITGGEIADAGSQTVDVAAGSGWIKATDSDTTEVFFFDWSAASGISVPTDESRFIGVEYNAGSPQVVSKSVDTWDFDTEFPLGQVVNEADVLHIINNPWWTGDAITNIIERLQSFGTLFRDDRIGGLLIGETGTRNVSLTAGTIWSRLTEFEIASQDTSGTDTFVTAYRDGAGEWVFSSSVSQYPNTQYDDGSGTLQDMNNSSFANLWFYIETDGEIVMVYPQAYHSNISEVKDEQPPTEIPDRVKETAIFLGRFIIQKGASSAEEIQSAFDTVFNSTQVTDHGNLSGLADDDHTQYALADGTRGDFAATNHTHPASDIVSGTLDDARISQSSVKQHEGSLAITESQITDLDHYSSTDFDTDFSGKSTSDLSEGTRLYYTNERVDDRVNSLLTEGTDISLTYDDGANTLTISSNASNTQLSKEQVQDYAWDILTGIQTLITITYDDANNNVDFVVNNNLSNYTNDAGFLTSEVNDLTAAVTWANIPDANITQSSVIQHQGAITGTGALNSGSITSGFGAIDIGSSSLTAGSFYTNTESTDNGHTIRMRSVVSGGSANSGDGIFRFLPYKAGSADYGKEFIYDFGANRWSFDNDLNIDNNLIIGNAITAGSITSGFGSIDIGSSSLTVGYTRIESGTTNYPLRVKSTDSIAGISLMDGSTGNDNVVVYASGEDFGIRTGGVNGRVIVDSSGNVTIGGAITAGSITSGFGAINIGSSPLTAGSGTFSRLDVDIGTSTGWIVQGTSSGLSNWSGLYFSNDSGRLLLRDAAGDLDADIRAEGRSYVSNGFDIRGGDFRIGTTTVIDSSRNLTVNNIESSGYLDFDNDVRLSADTHRVGLLRLTVLDGSYGGIQVNTTGNLYAFMSNGTYAGIYNDSTGEWGVQTRANSYTRLYYNGSTKLSTTSGGVDVTGDVDATDFNASSDIRIKTDIRSISNALESIRSIEPSLFFKNGEPSVGYIADEVMEVTENVVSITERGEYSDFKTMNLFGMQAYNTAGIKELDSEVELLRRRVEELEHQVQELGGTL